MLKRKPQHTTNPSRGTVSKNKPARLTWPTEVYVLSPEDIGPAIIDAEDQPQQIWGHMNNVFKFHFESTLYESHRMMDMWIHAMGLVNHWLKLPSTKGRHTYSRLQDKERKAMLYNLTWAYMGYTEGQDELTLKLLRMITDG